MCLQSWFFPLQTEGEGLKKVEIKYGPNGTVPLEVFDGAVALNGELLKKSTAHI